MSRPSRLDRVIEGVLTMGLLLSGASLLGGLLLESAWALKLGIVLLIATPVVRVVVVTVALAWARDWLFASISLVVLAVLGSSAWVGAGLGR